MLVVKGEEVKVKKVRKVKKVKSRESPTAPIFKVGRPTSGTSVLRRLKSDTKRTLKNVNCHHKLIASQKKKQSELMQQAINTKQQHLDQLSGQSQFTPYHARHLICCDLHYHFSA